MKDLLRGQYVWEIVQNVYTEGFPEEIEEEIWKGFVLYTPSNA